MTVGELRQLLQGYPEDMKVLQEIYSDYRPLEPEHLSLVWGVAQNEWVMRAHPTMSDENKARKEQFLTFAGN